MINIKGITKSFGNLQVLKGIDLQIGKGEIVSIVGPSGAGKTTLLQIIGTLDKPDSGQVAVDGMDVASSPRRSCPTSATSISALFSSSISCCRSLRRSRTS